MRRCAGRLQRGLQKHRSGGGGHHAARRLNAQRADHGVRAIKRERHPSGAPPPRPATLQVLVRRCSRRRRESPRAQPGGDGLLDGGQAAGPRQGSDRLRRADGTQPSSDDRAVPAGWLRRRCAGRHRAPMVKSAPSAWSPNARPRMAKNGVVHRAVESLRIERGSGVVGGWSPR